jgi:hypothetical protein
MLSIGHRPLINKESIAMSKETKTVEINGDLANYIEGLQYEVDSRKDIISFMIDKNMIDSVAFATYQKEYFECYSKYQMAKGQLEKTYVTPLLTGDQRANWNLDFETKTLMIELV